LGIILKSKPFIYPKLYNVYLTGEMLYGISLYQQISGGRIVKWGIVLFSNLPPMWKRIDQYDNKLANDVNSKLTKTFSRYRERREDRID
jgi:hypothetical protein